MENSDAYLEAFKIEQVGLIANATVRFDAVTETYTFVHQSSSYVNEGFSFDHFAAGPTRVRPGLIEFELTHEYTLGGGPVVFVTPTPGGFQIVIANASVHGRNIGVLLFGLDGQPCDSDFSIMAIMPVGH
jgi:hypothetical protein